ncbi:hypothetical protein [Oryzomonas rubra]|uniref:hypothetical protein n=1 Tax=Oryzomonas rubra TaxID=2509454 RepID=UPI00165E3BB8|nr:hypothetical protein [Oryzomonas rubra]
MSNPLLLELTVNETNAVLSCLSGLIEKIKSQAESQIKLAPASSDTPADHSEERA